MGLIAGPFKTDEANFLWNSMLPHISAFHAGYLSSHLQRDDESLDAAWAEVEAALPEGWMFSTGTGSAQYRDDEPFGARATPIKLAWPIILVEGYGPTPAAALRALAARLRESR